ncbi:MAG: hypothetical protein RSB82_00355 [Victivallaceae bacterium]
MKHQARDKKSKTVAARRRTVKAKPQPVEAQLINETQGVLETFSEHFPILNNFSEKDITGMMSLLSHQLNSIDYNNIFKGVFKNSKEDAAFAKQFTCLADHLNNISQMITRDLR